MKVADSGQLSTLLKRLKANVGNQELLAVHDGYQLWLGLLAYKDNQSQLLGCAASNAIDAASAVAEAKQRLSKQLSIAMPRQVTLITSCALAALLDLPVTPEKPRKAAEMESMISWELETQVADNNDQYSLGAILKGRDLIDAEHRQHIAQELETRRAAGNSLARFGEVALELGLIDQQQLQESLQLQEKLVVSDSHLACGWQVQSVTRDDNTEHQWLVAGIDTRLRRQWFNAFQSNGMKLRDIMPFSVCASAWACLHSELGNVVVVDAGQDSIVCYRLEQSQLAALQTQPRQLQHDLAQQCLGVLSELVRGDTEKILLLDANRSDKNSNNTAEDDILAMLKERFQRDCEWLVKLDTRQQHELSDQVVAVFYGAAQMLRKKSVLADALPSVLLPRIRPREPAPPVWKNPQVYRYGLPVLLLISMLGHGGYSLWRKEHLQDRLDSLDIKYQKKMALNKKLNNITGEYQKKQQQLQHLQKQVNDVAQQLAQLNNKVMARTRLIPRLVKTIALSVTNGVMLDSIVEPSRNSRDRFNVIAWAVNNPGASEFVERLQQLVGRLDYRVADPDIRAGIGRYGLNGYTINLWLIPSKTNDETKSSKS